MYSICFVAIGLFYKATVWFSCKVLYVYFDSQTQFGDALRTSADRSTATTSSSTSYSVRASEEGNIPGGAQAGTGVDADAGDMMLVPGSENGHVEEAAEYRFFLYRHWSLYDAMYHSPYVAAKLNVWTHQGTNKLQVSHTQIKL